MMSSGRGYEIKREISAMEEKQKWKKEKEEQREAEIVDGINNIVDGAAVGFTAGVFFDFASAADKLSPKMLTPRLTLVGAVVGAVAYAAKKLKSD